MSTSRETVSWKLPGAVSCGVKTSQRRPPIVIGPIGFALWNTMGVLPHSRALLADPAPEDFSNEVVAS